MKKITFTIVLIAAMCYTQNLLSQKTNSESFRTEIDNSHYWIRLAEMGLVPFNPVIPFTPAEHKGSEIITPDFITNSPDVAILDDADVTQSENSVFIDPNDNQHVFNSNNSGNWSGTAVGLFYGANYLFSNDTGLNWTGSSAGAGGDNSGDPAACIGINGRMFNGFIDDNGGQSIAYSDNEINWTTVVCGTAGTGFYDLLDKNHLWIDNTNSGQSGNLYNAWTRFESGHANDNEIEFTRSTDNGLTWSTPYNISSNIAAGSHNQGVNIQCNNTGWVFATWVAYDEWSTGNYGEDALCFARSSNGGVSFFSAQRIHNNILGIRPSNNSPTINPTGKSHRVNSFPSMAIDVSGGTYHGHQYIVWTNVGVPGTNTGTNVSVYMIKSTNGGTIWSTPVRVNQGTAADGYASYFPWLTCDPVTGNLYCVFYDDRNLGVSSSAVETWLAYSNDGGATWKDFRVSDVSFTPSGIPGIMANGYMGDYLGVAARDGLVYPTWTDNRSGRALTYVSPLNFGGSCVATGGACDEYISNVTIGSINNSSGCNGYEDFRNLSTNIPLNASETITITNGSTLYPSDECGIWVDWNRDDIFDPVSEAVTVSGTPGAGPYTATIAPPPGTSIGQCTMRVRISYNTTPTPCGTETYGEVEDYTISIGSMPIPAQSSSFSGNVRGYWFTAPTDFTISGLRVPADNPGDQTVEIIRFNSGPPPEWSTTTNDFVSLGRWVNVAGDDIISCNIPVGSGDYIGVLGCRGITTSYGAAPYVTSIDGYPVTLTRLGMQYQLPSTPAQEIFQEPSGSLGRVEMYYEKHSTWTGLADNNWNNTENWLSLFVPNVNNDVIIPAGCPNYPILGGSLSINATNGTFDCKSLNINTGATFTLTGGDVYNYGELIVSGAFNIADDFYLYSGSTVDLSGTIQIGNVSPHWGQAIHYSGSVFNQTGGNYYVEYIKLFSGCQYNGTGGYTHIYTSGSATNNNIEIDDPDSYFYRFNVDAGANAVLFDCSYDLEVAFSVTLEGSLNIGTHTLNTQYMDAHSDLTISSGGLVNVTGNGPYIHPLGSLTMSSGSELNSGTNIWFQLGSTENVSGGEIFLGGNFTDSDEIFTPTGGSVTFDGGNSASVTGPTTFFNLLIDKTGGTKSIKQFSGQEDIQADNTKASINGLNSTDPIEEMDNTEANDLLLASNITIANNLTINNGVFNTATFDINIAGDWLNNVGDAGFTEGTGRVVFNGPGHQYIFSSETFNILEANLGAAIRVTDISHTVTCNVYDWTAGGIDVLSGTFTALDLADNGIAGGFWLNPDGVINLTNSGTGTYVDLNGEIHIFGGIMTVSGSISEWPYTNNAVIEMSDGILDFTDCGIIITDNAFSLAENITGGTIRTSKGFSGNRADFTPPAGTFEFYGPSDAIISQTNGCTLNDVVINKSSKKMPTIQSPSKSNSTGRMDLTKGSGSKANAISLGNNFTTTGQLFVNSGSLTLSGHTLTVAQSINVHGTLTMDNPLDILNMGVNGADQLNFFNGSVADFTNGIANIYGWVVPNIGCSFNASTAHTFIFRGVTGGGLSNVEPTAVYGNVEINKNANQRTFIANNSVEPIIVNGNFIVHPDNEFQSHNQPMVVHGIVTDNQSSKIYLHNGAKVKKSDSLKTITEITYLGNEEKSEIETEITSKKGSKGGSVEIDTDFTLNGLLEVGDGDVLLHGHYDQAISGTLSISTGGSFICDEPTSSVVYVRGIFNMNGGLFEISNNHIFFSASSAISDGSIRVGGTFRAFYDGDFMPSGGEVEILGSGAGNYILLHANNYFHDLVINRTNYISLDAGHDLNIRNNFTLLSGGLNSNNRDIYVKGNWINDVGASGFSPTTGTVTFEGADHTQISSSSEHFYNVVVEKSSLALFLDSYGDIQIDNDLTINKGNYYPHENSITVNGNLSINDGGSLHMVANSALILGNGSSIDVNNGGELSLIGNPSYYATVSNVTSGNYNFSVNAGGTIASEYAFFEHMDNSGVSVSVAGIVSPTQAFNHCYFGVSASGWGAKLTINNDQNLAITGVNFSQSSGTDRNAWKYSGSSGTLTFIGATGDFAGPEFEEDPNDAIFWGAMDIAVDLKAVLEGPFNGSIMNTDYNNAGLIPLSQPYNVAPWNYSGTESVGIIPSGVTDWVLVELRDAAVTSSATSATIFETRAAFILEDGSIVDLDGTSPLIFNTSYNNGIYAVVRHINHMDIISMLKLVRSGGVYSHDFSSDWSQAYGGTGVLVQLSSSPDIWGMKSGDGDGDGDIGSLDTDIWTSQAGETGYKASDYNLNGQINNQDKNDHLVKNWGSISWLPE